jgi:hypothetical protein
MSTGRMGRSLLQVCTLVLCLAATVDGGCCRWTRDHWLAGVSEAVRAEGVSPRLPSTGFDIPEVERRGFLPGSEGDRGWEQDPVPATGEAQDAEQEFRELTSLEAFRRSVMNGRSDQLTGIWVEDVLAFRVQPGPTSHAPVVKDTFSIYKWAWKHGVVGLLIHDYRGGTQLYQLNPGVRIAAIYGNGGVDWYVSRGGAWYESRSGSFSGFAGPFRIWSCADCDFDVSVRELQYRHYAGNHRLAFQTCVTAEGRTGLVIIEAYLDRPPEPLRADGDSLERWERIYPVTLPRYRREVG